MTLLLDCVCAILAEFAVKPAKSSSFLYDFIHKSQLFTSQIAFGFSSRFIAKNDSMDKTFFKTQPRQKGKNSLSLSWHLHQHGSLVISQ
jgi:hypothetical protein